MQRGIGGPEILRVEDMPMPPPPRGDQVLLRIRASGVCFHDLLVREGTYRALVKLPLVPGHEMAGDIIAVGEDVTRIKVGDQVASTNRETCGQCDLCRSGQEGMCANQRFFGHNGPGSLRRICACARECTFCCAALDTSGNCLHASCAVGTELHAIREVGRTKAGDNVLVTGAGGGLGIHGVQVAKLCGAFVVALTTSPSKSQALRAVGADEVLVIQRGERFDRQVDRDRTTRLRRDLRQRRGACVRLVFPRTGDRRAIRLRRTAQRQADLVQSGLAAVAQHVVARFELNNSQGAR